MVILPAKVNSKMRVDFISTPKKSESSSFKMTQLEGKEVQNQNNRLKVSGENEELKKTIEELKNANKNSTARLIEVSSDLEKERRNNMRLAYKFEQDFEFHKQQVVNDCGRHIEELQEEHREHIRNIERKLSTDQRKVFIAKMRLFL